VKMRVTNRPPVFVPLSERAELAKQSKAALMDLVWSLAGRCAESSDDRAEVMALIRQEVKVRELYRQ